MDHPPRPADLDVVRASYDRVADNYVDMVVATGLGDLRHQPWLKAAIDVFADAVGQLGPVLDVGCGPGTVTAYLLAAVLASFARALVPGGQVIIATHGGDGDFPRTEAYGGVPVSWTTHKWLPAQLADLVEQVGLRVVAELQLPADGPVGPAVVLVARRRDEGAAQ